MSDEQKYPAPALARGLRILQALNAADGPMTLEELAQEVGYPKASLLRLLETLTMLNLVERNGVGKSYSALAGVAYRDRWTRVRGVVRGAMERLTLATGITSEWYEAGSSCMKLIDLFDPPDAHVRIAARVGFRRRIDDELEAVTRVALASPLFEYTGEKLWQYTETGKKVALSAKKCRKQITKTRDKGITMDPNWNGNGIRRYAAWLMDGDEFVGVLALAEIFTPGADKHIESHMKELKKAAVATEKEFSR